MGIHLAVGTNKAAKALALAAIVTLCSTDLLQDAVANGDTRTLSFHHVHSGAAATVTFKRNGRYDPAALKQLNVLMQDWRRKEPTNMDPQLFDIVWEVYRETGATAPIEIIGGYRSPATNAMLRSRSRGVAQTSLHMQGKAMDFYIPGVPLSKIREAGLRLQRGGVGFYPTSGSPFVHLDTGGIRHWPRMSRPELARVFPNGRTVHVPADGKPMSGYALALADVEAKGKEPGGAGAAFAGLGGGNNPKRNGASTAGSKNIFASLFGGKDDDEDDAPAASTTQVADAEEAPAAKPATNAAAAAPVEVASAAPMPLPMPNPLPRSAAQETPAVPEEAPMALAFAGPAPMPQPNPLSRGAAASVAAATPPASPPVPASSRAELAALAAAIPLPGERPPNPTGGPAGVTRAPVTTANPPLPEVIVRGTGGQGPALSYANAGGDIFPRERLQPGRAPSSPATVASEHARRAHSAEMLTEIRRLFSGPTVAYSVTLRTPELRRFAAFVAPPRQVVETHFGADGTNGLSTARFEGAAIVAVPVVAMMSGPAPLKNPL
ncbi:protein of unknown function DUF882 [Ancylobacter novellus DSM 506]|uniref:Murein endopeptidase K n=1 Tax=Ancylobacter novellus (strain ATCC 8093 / DSM 506 / JCM 20403 / CCM 1077 / IAM 12100 / NBRC 12443 / NCIMB 10456) TaxID=639283 RepID=D7A7F6_ANCN5|nr:DUF882 domain-containing protein [Ancylobacter novellus]ADH90387.1 protein of unknown function DUF882 [Ancylobacter novellus DSM 506]